VARRALTGALLVGGGSTRFGSPKALAELAGETLAERGLRTLREVCEEVFAVGKQSDELPLSAPLVDDGSSVRAPIVGVIAALRAAREDVCIVLPVDCPLVDADLLRRLASACEGVDAAVPQTGPLPGAYGKTVLPALERALATGELALHAALRPATVHVVRCDETLLANVNTRDDLRHLG
jgi:molybdopterin-guanine dinucleotide biosynthesis protein A